MYKISPKLRGKLLQNFTEQYISIRHLFFLVNRLIEWDLEIVTCSWFGKCLPISIGRRSDYQRDPSSKHFEHDTNQASESYD